MIKQYHKISKTTVLMYAPAAYCTKCQEQHVLLGSGSVGVSTELASSVVISWQVHWTGN